MQKKRRMRTERLLSKHRMDACAVSQNYAHTVPNAPTARINLADKCRDYSEYEIHVDG